MASTAAKSTTSVYDIVTEQILAQLEAGTVPWHRPWKASGVPVSMSTRKPYRGVNPFLLAMSADAGGWSSPWWGTYKHIEQLGGQVRRGERSTLVVFWKTGTRDLTAEEKAAGKSARWAVLRYFRVFNAEQADGLPARFHPAAEEEGRQFDPIAEAELIVKGWDDGPEIVHQGDRACYSPGLDVVYLPAREAFESAHGYYSTAFHELTHSTGHPTRLARATLMEAHGFGDPSYSKEELVAEMGAAMLSGVAGIDQLTVPQSAAYLASWIKVLRGDSKLIVQAAGQAQKAADLILGTTFPDDTDD